jgi:hypothetical protein
MKKIAPTLQGFAVNDFDGTIDMNAYRRELRALLRVARAARHLSLYAPTERWVALKNAQDALDRASGGER